MIKSLEQTAFDVATNTAVLYGINQTGVGQQIVSAFPGGAFGGAMAGSAVIEGTKLVKMALGEFGVISKQPVRALDEVAIDFAAQAGAIYGLEMFGLSNQLGQFFPNGPVGDAMQGAVLVEAVDLVTGYAKEKGWLNRIENKLTSIF